MVDRQNDTQRDVGAGQGSEARGLSHEARLAEGKAAYEADDKEGAAEIARAIYREDPRSYPACTLLVEAEAFLGKTQEAFDTVASAHFSPDRKLRLAELAIRRSSRSGAFDTALTLARSLAWPGAVPYEHILLLARAAKRQRQIDAIKVLAEQLDPAERYALLADLAVRAYELSAAEAHLAQIPEKHPERPVVVRKVFDLARELRDDPATHRTGMELLRAGVGADVALPFITARSAFMEGFVEDGKFAFDLARKAAVAIRADDKLFAKKWRAVANFTFDIFDIDKARADVARAIEAELPLSDKLHAQAEFNAFIDEFREDLEWSRKATAALIRGEQVTWPKNELVRIVARPKIFNPGNLNAVSSQLSWMKVVAETFRQARAAGQRAYMVPLYLGELAERQKAPPLTLSYHTTGKDKFVMHFKEADLPAYICLDRGGYAGWSKLADMSLKDLPLDTLSLAEAQKFHAQFKKEVLERNASKYVQPDPSIPIKPLPEKYVFVAMQIPTDRVQTLAYVPMIPMIEMVARRFDGTGTAVMVKRHPLCKDERISEVLEKLADEGKIEIRDDNIHTLISGAEAVITTNSGVGSEALIHLKPVYLFGKADYSAAVHTVRNEAELIAKTSPITSALTPDEVKKFLLYYRKLFLVNTTRQDALAKAINTRVVAPALRRKTTTTTAPRPVRKVSMA